MSRRLRLSALLLVVAFAASCSKASTGGSPTTPTGSTPGSTPTPTGSSGFTFRAEPGVRAAGSLPAAVVVGSTTYLTLLTPTPAFFASGDGLTFTPVGGARPQGATGPVSLTQAGGAVRMYFVDVPTPSVVQSAIGNGTSFTVEPGTRGTINSRQQPNPPRVVALPSGGFRAYYRDQPSELGVIRSARSDDGLTFVEESGDRLVGTSGTTASYDWALPSVAPASSGFLMVVVQLPRVGGATSLFLARSTDGLSWTVEPQAFVTGASDPVLVATGSDQFRVYYTANGLVQSGSIAR